MGGTVGDLVGGARDSVSDFITGDPSRQTSRPVIDPALLSPEQINAAINQIMGMASGGPAVPGRVGAAATPGQVGPAATPAQLSLGIEQSPFFQMFRSALTDRFTPTQAENNLLSAIMDQTSAQFARRGLGASPIAASATGAAIAPALVQLRQQQIGNLANALSQTLQGQQLGLTQRGQNITTNLANLQAGVDQRGQNVSLNLGNLNAGVTQRGQDIQSAANSYGTQLQALLNLLQFGQRNPVGQRTNQQGGQGPIGGLFNPINTNLSLGAGGGGSPSGAN